MRIIRLARRIRLYRGVSIYNKSGKYWTTDKEWARQFTQSGRDSEIKETSLDESAIYRSDPLPHATDAEEVDAAVEMATSQGFMAIWVDEGNGEPNSVLMVSP